jgi:small GTP-binding protein
MDDSEESETDLKNLISLKILLIGDSHVGKTSLLLKYVDDFFPEEHIATIGIEYKDKIINKDGYNIRLQIWDTAGQERFNSITKNIYRNTNGVLFVYDVTNRKSYNSMKNWIKDTEKIDKDIKGIILANKIDLEEREVNTDELEELGNKMNMKFLETSAKDNINVKEAFILLVEELLKDKNEKEILEMYSRNKRSDLSIGTKKTAIDKKKKGCC